MKKILALIVACVTVASSFAAEKYKMADFRDNVPVLMRGTFKVNSWVKEGAPDCKVAKERDSFDVYLAFCQPCINCLPCESINSVLQNATLYIVEKTKNNEGKKVAYITAEALYYDGVNDVYNSLPVDFSTGAKPEAKDRKKGEVVISLSGLSQDKFGALGNLALIGTWNMKSWFTGTDSDVDGGANHAVLMSIVQKLDATITSVKTGERWGNGTLALRRDDGFTKKLMLEMTEPARGSKKTNPWLICGPGATPTVFGKCYQVLTQTGENNNPADKTKMETMVENYIIQKSGLKSYKEVSLFGSGRNMFVPTP